LVLLLATACNRGPAPQSQPQPEPSPTPSAARSSIPIPGNLVLIKIAESSDSKAIAYSYYTDQSECVAVVAEAPGTQPQKVLCGKSIPDLQAAPAQGLFSASIQGDRGTLVVFDSSGHELSRTVHPNHDHYFVPIWSADAHKAFFQMDKPGVTDDETGGMEFTAIGDVDVHTGKIAMHPLKKMAMYLGYDPSKRELVATHGWNEYAPEAPAETYNENGDFTTTRKVRGTRFSAGGKYGVPHLHEALSWKIYRQPDDAAVAEFKCNYKSDPHVIEMFQAWHPTVERYFFNLHQTEPANGDPSDDNTVQLWDVEANKVLKSFHEDPQQPYAPARDGKHLIFYRQGKLVFEPI
jgi:hypothetical protein